MDLVWCKNCFDFNFLSHNMTYTCDDQIMKLYYITTDIITVLMMMLLMGRD